MEQPGISLFEDKGRVIVKIEGFARVDTAVFLKENLAQMQITHGVGIDWCAAEHIDACVLQVLLSVRRSLTERGLSFIVDQDNSKVRWYLKLSGMSEYFPVRNDPHPSSPTEGGADA
jgi:anti-anti-sigma regulatory factor